MAIGDHAPPFAARRRCACAAHARDGPAPAPGGSGRVGGRRRRLEAGKGGRAVGGGTPSIPPWPRTPLLSPGHPALTPHIRRPGGRPSPSGRVPPALGPEGAVSAPCCPPAGIWGGVGAAGRSLRPQPVLQFVFGSWDADGLLRCRWVARVLLRCPRPVQLSVAGGISGQGK